MSNANLYVELDRINPLNVRCGDILSGFDGEQYTVVDVFGPKEEKIHRFMIPPYVVLEKLEEDERIKPEFITGRVNL